MMQTQLWTPSRRLHRPSTREVQRIEKVRANPWGSVPMEVDSDFIFAENTPWSPLSLPGIALWLRADLGISLTSSNVTTWTDQVGGVAFTGSSTGYNASDANFGGLASVPLPHSSVLSAATYSIGNPYSIVAVFRSHTSTASEANVLNTVTNQVQIGVGYPGTTYFLYTIGGAASGGTIDTNAHAIIAVNSTGAGTVYVDSSSIVLTSHTVASTGTTGLQLNGGSVAGTQLDIAEFIVTSTAMAYVDRHNLCAYLARYGLSLT